MTGATPQYPVAPITEAIIDLQVQPAEGVENSQLRMAHRDGDIGYPKCEQLLQAVGQMVVGPGVGSASVKQNELGWKFVGADGLQILQCRKDHFTLSRLSPYEGWEPFQREARRLWKIYRYETNPSTVTRVAVRYINRIDIPRSPIDLKDYFRTSPEISPDLPQALEGYFMRLQLPFPDLSSHCFITQAIAPPSAKDTVSVVLDIDFFQAVNFEADDDETVWGVLSSHHVMKNTIFESCITDRTRELFSRCQS
ncbi:TIGR04255 family protein [Rubinisphaera margarita]|uniref:TIGR04255 family protein n=1 Tax=Rubinisphaera margarita TaxID=2909586 RepID=UPI001EE81EEB|nr:TIGR04255 family protein [Rubinisphaera margarita]MCG6157107.1 TIGR04255 family protein [Rubinisphaera margarita]